MEQVFKSAKEIIEEMIENGELPNCEFLKEIEVKEWNLNKLSNTLATIAKRS